MLPPNKRLKLPGAPKYGRIAFVRHIRRGNQISLQCASGPCARSLSAIR